MKPSTTIYSILVLAFCRLCQPEALPGEKDGDSDKKLAEPDALDTRLHARDNIDRRPDDDRLRNVPLKLDSPVAFNDVKDVNDVPLPAGPAGVEGKQVRRDDADDYARRDDRRNPPPRDQGDFDEGRGSRRAANGGGAAGGGSTRIADQPDCRDDVRRICVDGNLNLNNNFAVLDCLQRDRRDNADLSDKCHHYIWFYKKNLTRDDRFDTAALEVCKDALETIPECKKQERGSGNLISCLIEHADNVTNEQCRQFLNKMEAIVFSDFRLVNKFVEKCSASITKTGCGRLPGKDEVPSNSKSPHQQGATIACLQTKVADLDLSCRKEILRISELQADDYHLDRALYFACRDDRERFCERLTAGRGQIYKCLMRHKFDDAMSSDCRKELTRRQTLTSEDWKVSKGLVANCRKDVKHHQCLNQARSDALSFRHGKLSIIILCLENAMHMNLEVSHECQAELLDLRKQLMEDFSITPEIVRECGTEIAQQCDGGLHRKGKTLHCLMDLMRPNKKQTTERVTATCKTELMKLMKEADVGSDFRIDTMLQEACQPVADVACRDVRPGDARIITCLLEKMDSSDMIPECEERLLEIQYFITRDWKMDPRIYRKCRHDASTLCHAAAAWNDMNPNQQPTMAEDKKAHHGYVLACLFRFSDNIKGHVLRPECAGELKRAMRERAVSVHLQPELEEPCLLDLGKYCSENTEKGTEVDCLQDNYDKLVTECQQAVNEITEREAEDIEMDRLLVKACSSVMTKYCRDLVDNDIEDEGRMMECLIQHKNAAEMNEKCKSGVVHYQLLSLKQVSFNYKFKTACKNDVVKNCPNIKNKIQAVTCLSEHVRNDTLTDMAHRITPDCRQQIKVELLRRNEDARLDPELIKVCGSDLDTYCSAEDFGAGKKLKCLRQHRKDLKPACHRMIFNRDKEIVKDSSVDYSLQVTCKAMIDQYCENADEKDVLECLKPLIDNRHFDHRCRKIVVDRMRIQKSDYRLSPNLEKACGADIPKYCKSFIKGNSPIELEGIVIKCLTKQFSVPNRLTEKCAEEVKNIIEESQKDVRQDHVLYNACERDIESLCGHLMRPDGEDAHGKIEECLKSRLNDIRSKKCRREVAELVQELKVDIEVDPLLHEACATDLRRNCPDVPAGDGQQMSCILAAMEDPKIASHMTKECKEKLGNRKKMWELAAQIAPVETFGEIVDSIQMSPNRNYFAIVLFSCLAFIFMFGLVCGRVTKRLHRQVKDR